MKVAGEWLQRHETQVVLAMLAQAGHQALPVGGCVRNAILGTPVADVDIATDALPARVTELATAAGLRAVPTGIEHGTVTVIAGDEAYEITTFRRDVETDGRRAVVAFSDRIEEDAQRRDFTMNALYARADGTVIDPTGQGLGDALSRTIRFVGLAEDRIREDYLRILRFFRFTAWYGDPARGPDAEALSACAELAEGITGLSHERLGAEMRKLLAAPDPSPAVSAMAMSGVLGRVLPGADPRALPVLVHLEAGTPPDWLARLAVIGGENPGRQLRLSRSETRSLAILRDAMGATDGPAALGWRHGAQLARAAVLARAAIFAMPPPEGWQAEVERGAHAGFPVSAADLAPLAGAALGARLKALQTRWLAGGLQQTRAELLAPDFHSPPDPL